MLARGALEGTDIDDEASQQQSFSQDWRAV
jgi:hypothetical protein